MRAMWAALALMSCQFVAQLPDSARVRCDATIDCPSGWQCLAASGRCVQGNGGPAPMLSLEVEPPLGGPSDRYRLTVAADVSLLGPPRCVLRSVSLGEVVIGDLTGSGPWRLDYVPSPPLPGGDHRILCAGASTRGVEGLSEGVLAVDALAAEIRAFEVQLASVPPVTTPTALGRTGSATVTARLSEPPASFELFTGPEVFATPLDGGSPLTRVYRLQLLDGGAGSVEVTARAVDQFGNASMRTLSLEVDGVAPVAPASMVWRRAPFGSLSGSASFDLSASVEPGSLVVVSDELGEPLGSAIADGGLVLVATPLTDRQNVWAEVFDRAGNGSGRVVSASTALTLVPGATSGQVEVVGAAGLGPLRADALAVDPTLLRAVDGQTVAVAGASSFRELGSSFEGFGSESVVYDEASGLIHTVGGEGLHFTFNGKRFSEAPQYEGEQPQPGVAYDRSRGVMVVFGGDGTNGVREYLDGRWSFRAPRPGWPAIRREPVLVEAPRGVLLLGGRGAQGTLNEAWLWAPLDEGWQRLDAGTLPMNEVSAVFDVTRREAVIVGRRDAGVETWRFDGEVFARQVTRGAPPTAVGPMAYDSKTQDIYLAARVGRDAHLWRLRQGEWVATTIHPGFGQNSENGAYLPATGQLLSSDRVRARWITPADGGSFVGTLRELNSPTGRGFTTYDWRTERLLAVGESAPDFGTGPTFGWWHADGGWRMGARPPAPPHFVTGLADGGVAIRTRWDTWVLNGAVWDRVHDGGTPAEQERPGALFAGPSLTWLNAQFPAPFVPAGLVRGDGFWALNDTEVWRLGTGGWRSLGPSPAPSAAGMRFRAAVLEVPSTSEVVLVGGGRAQERGVMPPVRLRVLDDGGVQLIEQLAPNAQLARFGQVAAWHPIQQRFYVQGGNEVSGPQRSDVFSVEVADGGFGVNAVALADPEGDGNPEASVNSGFGWSSDLRRLVLARGELDVGSIEQTWVMEGPTNRPALTARFSMEGRWPEPLGLAELELVVAAEGQGVVSENSRVSAPGVVVQLFVDGDWRRLGVCQQPTCTYRITDVGSLRALLSYRQELVVRLETEGMNGQGQALLRVDALQVRMRSP
jgi:hypothetical protein